MRRQGCDIDDLNFYSFSNEGPVEHGIGHGVQQGQYSVLSHEEYVCQKVRSCNDMICQCCETNFDYPICTRRQYKEPLLFNVSAEEVFTMREKVLANKPKKKRKKKSAELRRDLKELKGISKYFRPQPTQTVRDKYKAMPGFAPTVVIFHINLYLQCDPAG